MKNDQLILFAMNEKGLAVLETVLDEFPTLLRAVIGAHDRSLTRDYYDEIAAHCRRHDVPFYDRQNAPPIDTPYAIAVGWRWLIDAPNCCLIIFHDSLLPRYRGFNPLVTALIKGDTEIGVTALLATNRFDQGEIVARRSRPIRYPIKIQQAIDEIRHDYQGLMRDIAGTLNASRPLVGTPQDESQASYSLWRDEEDYLIDWSAPAAEVRRFIDAVGTPYKGAASYVDGRLVRILDAEEVDDVSIANRTAGKVLFMEDRRPIVVCGSGLLKINEIILDKTGQSFLPLPRFRVRFHGAQGGAPEEENGGGADIPHTRPPRGKSN